MRSYKKKITQNILNASLEVCNHLNVREGELDVW